MTQLIPRMSSSTGSVLLNTGTCKSSFAEALASFWLCLQQPEGMTSACYSKSVNRNRDRSRIVWLLQTSLSLLHFQASLQSPYPQQLERRFFPTIASSPRPGAMSILHPLPPTAWQRINPRTQPLPLWCLRQTQTNWLWQEQPPQRLWLVMCQSCHGWLQPDRPLGLWCGRRSEPQSGKVNVALSYHRSDPMDSGRSHAEGAVVLLLRAVGQQLGTLPEGQHETPQG